MKKLIKKGLKILILIGIILLIISIILSVINTYHRLIYNIDRYSIKDNFTRKEKKAFELMSDRLLEIFEREKRNYNDLDSIYVFSILQFSDHYEFEITMFMSDGEKSVINELFYEEKEAIDAMRESFNSKSETGSLSLIKVIKDRVIFTSSAPYMVIYNPKATKPSYITDEHETEDEVDDLFFIDKLSSHLYEAVIKPQKQE